MIAPRARVGSELSECVHCVGERDGNAIGVVDGSFALRASPDDLKLLGQRRTRGVRRPRVHAPSRRLQSRETHGGIGWYVLETMDAKRKLKGMLARIFSDAVANDDERFELKAFLSSGTLSVADIKDVFADFAQTTWNITMADGVISDAERRRLNEIVKVLGLEIESLPIEWVRTLRGDAPPAAS